MTFVQEVFLNCVRTASITGDHLNANYAARVVAGGDLLKGKPAVALNGSSISANEVVGEIRSSLTETTTVQTKGVLRLRTDQTLANINAAIGQGVISTGMVINVFNPLSSLQNVDNADNDLSTVARPLRITIQLTNPMLSMATATLVIRGTAADGSAIAETFSFTAQNALAPQTSTNAFATVTTSTPSGFQIGSSFQATADYIHLGEVRHSGALGTGFGSILGATQIGSQVYVDLYVT